jgi:hypothetical protein
MAARKTKKKTTKAVATRPKSGALALPDELSDELEKYINRDKASASGAGGGMSFIRTRGGQFAFNDAVLEQPLRVVVLGAVRENLYYPKDFDPDVSQSPSCFALDVKGDETAMGPPADLKTKEAEKCSECWANAFRSAERGKGKACKNNVRMVLLPYQEGVDFSKVTGARLSVPPTSLKNWSAYTNKVTEGMRAPLFAVITELTTQPAERGGFTMDFGFGGVLSNPDIMVVKDRVDSDGLSNLHVLPITGAADEEPTAPKVVRKKAKSRRS